ncbi:MAG TPA: EAL domain-containing protein [Burkholderiaceae bacterium]|nr:EAL domain-containing protein [Burkholderiaceae bacterium]
MHRLLKRQIKRYLGADHELVGRWQAFFDAVEDSYQAAEKERQLLEHTLDINSRELTDANAQLRKDLQARQRIEQALRASEHKTRQIIDTAQDAVISADGDGRIADWNQAAEDIFGWTRAQALGQLVHELIIPQRNRLDPLLGLAGFLDGSQTRRGKVRLELTALHRDGQEFPAELALSSTQEGEDRLFHLFVRDISERKRAEENLFREKELAQVTLQSIADGVITTDAQGRVTYLNPVAALMTGWSADQVCGQTVSYVFNVKSESTASRSAQEAVESCLAKGLVVELSKDSVLTNRKGRPISIESSVAPIRNRAGLVIGSVIVFRDVSQARAMASKLSWQANHDALTGLINRTAFEKKLEKLVDGAKLEGQHHALCYLDLDQFKVVNDHCGHMAGDELLRQLSTLLSQKVRDADTLARLGGDEFGLLLANCPIEVAQKISDDLCQVVREFRFVWQEKLFSVGVSIGLVEIGPDCESVERLLSAADAACYAAKERGRNRVQRYKPDDTHFIKLHGEMQWVSRIHKTFDENRFCLYAQPIVSLGGQEAITHYEILLRMIDTEGQLISPIAFIPAAERYQMMTAIDRWVLTTLTRMLGRTDAQFPADAMYCLNLSGQSFNDDQFLEFVLNTLDEMTWPAQQLCFEVTETAAITNLTKAIGFIQKIKGRGCRFSLDDFGNGLSSFAYLKNLPVDYLKVDGEFVKDVATDPIDYAMVEAINNIGHRMGLKTIAEFVETEAVMKELRVLGVDYAQGYYVGRPAPLEALALPLVAKV